MMNDIHMLRGLKQFNLPEIEEKVLKFWKDGQIFQKSIKQREGKKPFRFFEGPPTANGKPGTHHVLTRAFKDIILRYKTMRGYYVSRRAGWDTHGLPVELEVEKELGIKNKQEIEKFGIAEFNAQAKNSVWKYKSDWEKLTERVGFWLDFENAYVTYDNFYIETLWWIFGEINKRGLLKNLYKVVPWCPRCQTSLSSHELGQPGAYKLTKDPSVYVKFKVKSEKRKANEYLLVWTTTPWTLPANAAVAVNPKLTYTKYKVGDDYLWSYNLPPKLEGIEISVVEKMSGKRLVGLEYEPLYSVRNDRSDRDDRSVEHAKRSILDPRSPNIYQVIAADFVSTEEGTGLVHIAPAFGEDDLQAWRQMAKSKEQIEVPVTIDDRGIVNKNLPGAGKFIKEADKDIIADLAKRKLLYNSGVIEHEYPFCWRCSTPLIYFARDSWFIEMSKLRDDLLSENKKINWIPEHIKDGRFGEWLKEIKDWAISRERYWGTPLPIWTHEIPNCDQRLVIGSLEDLNKHAYNKNQFFIARHAESNHNVEDFIAAGPERGKLISKLTKKGVEQVEKLGKELKNKKIDFIYASPYFRTKQTAKIIAKATGAKVIFDKRLGEINAGIFNGRPVEEYRKFFSNLQERFVKTPPGGENLTEVQRRMAAAVQEINSKHNGKNILIVSHGDPLWIMERAIGGWPREKLAEVPYVEVGNYKRLTVNNWPFNNDGELDVHRPFADAVYLKCPKCGKKMVRVKEVADVWFDSGAMPFAAWHYPFENKEMIDGHPRRTRMVGAPTEASGFPADYITEAIDQTRGWFYTLLAVSTLLQRGAPYLNVISLGLLLDKNGQKMSKSKGNVIDPWEMIQKYGADVLRWYFYTVNPPGEPKRFDENDLRKTFNKLFMLIYNSFVFYNTYGAEKSKLQNPCLAGRQANDKKNPKSKILDQWILARLNQAVSEATEKLEKYEVGEAAKTIEGLVDDLSRWYIRRSRKNVSGKTLKLVLEETAKLVAPFAPFFSEALWQSLNTGSVHLQDWPEVSEKPRLRQGFGGQGKAKSEKDLLGKMAEVRRLASLALAEREKAGIKVRQPLSVLSIKNKVLSIKDKELLQLLKDEVNVREIIFDIGLQNDVELDTKITPELKKEGLLRDLVRTIQGLRQEAGYKPGEPIVLMAELPKELFEMIEDRGSELRRAVNAKDVELFSTPTPQAGRSPDRSVGENRKFDAELYTKIDEQPIWVAVRKI